MTNHPNRSNTRNIVEIDGEKFFEWTVKMRVHHSWVADGFNLTAERAHNMLTNDLQGGYTHEMQAEIISAPSDVQILKEQGYTRGNGQYACELQTMKQEPKIYPATE